MLENDINGPMRVPGRRVDWWCHVGKRASLINAELGERHWLVMPYWKMIYLDHVCSLWINIVQVCCFPTWPRQPLFLPEPNIVQVSPFLSYGLTWIIASWYCYCLLLLPTVIAIAHWHCPLLLLLHVVIAHCYSYCRLLLLLPITKYHTVLLFFARTNQVA